MSKTRKLLNAIGGSEVFIQTHNFPDHDAVASAFALQRLLSKFNVVSHIMYEGEIQRDSLKRMINELGIKLSHFKAYELTGEEKIIIIDGCKGNRNVYDLHGKEIAIIDHHEVTAQEDVKFNDIRSNYGACSSIIFDYYNEEGIALDKDVATALIIGINMDTALMTRSVSEFDIFAYSQLYVQANIFLVNSILRNYIQIKELSFYKYAIENIVIKERIAFCYFKDGCNQNLLGILGDFFLAVEEVDFVILCAKNVEKINLSLRSENRKLNASEIIQKAIKGIGFGGGHVDMAGGFIENIESFNESELYMKFYNIIKEILGKE